MQFPKLSRKSIYKSSSNFVLLETNVKPNHCLHMFILFSCTFLWSKIELKTRTALTVKGPCCLCVLYHKSSINSIQILFLVPLNIFACPKNDIRDRIGGGQWPKGGTNFSAPKAPKKWLKWPILGAAGAENLEKFGWFSKNSPIFAKKWGFYSMKMHSYA